MTKKFVPSDIPKYLSVLQSTIARLEEISTNKSDIERVKSPPEGEWSVNQTLAHLCSCQDVWSYSIFAMLAEDRPQLFPLHPRKMAATMKYEELSFLDLFSRFKSGREELLRILRKIPEGNWAREATIKGRQHSVFSQVRRMAIHEADHWEQIERLLN